MKTFQTKIFPGFLFLMGVLPFLITSCSDDEPDLRDEITGQYSYILKIYVDDGKDLIYVGDQDDNYDIEGTMRVIKSTDNVLGIDFYDGNIRMFQGVDVQDTGNAIVFNIPDQEGWIGPTQVQVAGYKYWDVESSSFDGAFLYEDESVEIAFTARIMNVDTGLVMILTAFRK